MAECRACGLRFLRVQPTGEWLGGLYSCSYFEQDFRCGRSPAGYFTENAFREENRGLLEAFEALTPPGRLLEVGCAGGWLLEQARERGWQAQGVEISAEAVAHARARGLEVFHGQVAEAGLPADHFDLVYLGDVLEHVPDCRAALAEVARVLRRGGHLYLRGPLTTHALARSLALWLYRYVRGGIVLAEPPYHLWEFTPRSLAALLERVGLEVVRMRQSKIPPGRTHGKKTRIQRLAMNLLDALNLPLTRAFNVLGDRVVVVARRA
ncbi:MAG TPA: class I SAM-dependent methyltransferase [Candidatus Eisenbacteria bacterium]